MPRNLLSTCYEAPLPRVKLSAGFSGFSNMGAAGAARPGRAWGRPLARAPGVT